MVHPKPVFSVLVRTGMAWSTEAASENGVSLFHAKIRIGADQSTVLLVSDAKAIDAPLEPTISWRWNECLVGAITVRVIRTTTHARSAVSL